MLQHLLFCALGIRKIFRFICSDSSVEIGGLSEGTATLWICFSSSGMNFDSFEVISIYGKCPRTHRGAIAPTFALDPTTVRELNMLNWPCLCGALLIRRVCGSKYMIPFGRGPARSAVDYVAYVRKGKLRTFSHIPANNRPPLHTHTHTPPPTST